MEYIEVSAKTIDDALTEASIKLGTTSDKLEYEVIDKGSNGFLGIGSRDAVIKVKKAEASVEDEIREFLDSVFKAMKLEVTIDIKVDEDNRNVDVELNGPEMGVLIGKRGQTLDSLQYLTNLAINKQWRLTAYRMRGRRPARRRRRPACRAPRPLRRSRSGRSAPPDGRRRRGRPIPRLSVRPTRPSAYRLRRAG